MSGEDLQRQTSINIQEKANLIWAIADKDKKDTYVLDFCNKPEDIKKSFEPFYKGTELIKPVNVNYVYTFRKDIQMFQLWTEGDEQKFYDLLQNISKQKDRLGACRMRSRVLLTDTELWTKRNSLK